MKGFESSSYGDAFADVYDEWYGDVSDVEATVETLRYLGGDGSYLELGVGTGRIALALAAEGVRVTGIDSSPAMLDRLRSKLPADSSDSSGPSVELVHGDMVADLPPGPFDVVFIAYNTFFSIGSAPLQSRLFTEVARRLSPRGCFVIEAAVPDSRRPAGGTVGVRSIDVDRVVLSVDMHDPANQVVEGQFVEFTEESGIRLRPWRIRYCAVDEIDAMAHEAGLTLVHRWESMSRDAFAPDSAGHVSVYSLRSAGT